MGFTNRLTSTKLPVNKSFVTIDCDPNDKQFNYTDLASPAAVLNEKQLRNSLSFFSTSAPKKKTHHLKKVSADGLRKKRKCLENYFSSIDLDSWSERNFVLPNSKSEDWHDDLHYIVLKQQERSNFIHQIWLFLMLALVCLMLIAIAGVVYSKNGVHKNIDQNDSYEFIQKFIEEFNHTESPPRMPDPSNHYTIERQNEESVESWLSRESKYLSSLLGARENEPLNLTKKSTHQTIRRASDDDHELEAIESMSNPNYMHYEPIANESSFIGKMEDEIEHSFESIKNFDFDNMLSKMRDLF